MYIMKTLKKEIKDDTEDREYTHARGPVGFIVWKWSWQPKINEIFIKKLMHFFTEIERRNLKIHMKAQRTLGSPNNPEWENTVERWVTIPDFKQDYKALVAKTA